MGRICVIRQFYVPLDARVRREVEALASAGHDVDVVCLRGPGEDFHERIGRVTLWRLPFRRRRGTPGRYFLEYAMFLLAAALACTVLHLRRPYDLVQVNSLPDILVFSAVVPRALNARVLLDLHECMPEFFASKFGTELDGTATKTIAWLEQVSIGFADAAITCTEQMRQTFISRGTPEAKIGTILNGSDEKVFDPDLFPPALPTPERFHLISHGSVEERYGLDTLLRAVALLESEIPELTVAIYGAGSYLGDLRRLTHELGITDKVYFSDGFVPLPELVKAIAGADAGVVAMKRDAFRDLTLCNKMYDFIAMRKPAIVSRTQAVTEYFDESCFQMFEAGDEQDLARAVRELHGDADLARRMVEQASRVGTIHSWPGQRTRYLEIVDRLVRQR